MSRIGRLPIQVPPSVDVSIVGRDITVKGPKGSLHRASPPRTCASRWRARIIVVERPSEAKHHKQLMA